jgi:hypothetical protein
MKKKEKEFKAGYYVRYEYLVTEDYYVPDAKNREEAWKTASTRKDTGVPPDKVERTQRQSPPHCERATVNRYEVEVVLCTEVVAADVYAARDIAEERVRRLGDGQCGAKKVKFLHKVGRV